MELERNVIVELLLVISILLLETDIFLLPFYFWKRSYSSMVFIPANIFMENEDSKAARVIGTIAKNNGICKTRRTTAMDGMGWD